HLSLVSLALHPFPTRRSSDLADQSCVSKFRFPSLFRRLAMSSGLTYAPTGFADWLMNHSQPIRLGIIGCGNVLEAYIPQCEKLRDRKSTRLNSSHGSISYAVF